LFFQTGDRILPLADPGLGLPEAGFVIRRIDPEHHLANGNDLPGLEHGVRIDQPAGDFRCDGHHRQCLRFAVPGDDHRVVLWPGRCGLHLDGPFFRLGLGRRLLQAGQSVHSRPADKQNQEANDNANRHMFFLSVFFLAIHFNDLE
jgi:hypothetical protein